MARGFVVIASAQSHYRRRVPEYVGSYIYCGHFNGEIRSLVYDRSIVVSNQLIAKVPEKNRKDVQIAAIATDQEGELLLVSRADGRIYTLRPNEVKRKASP